MSQPCDKPENNLYLLAFIDVVDRLDILLLEIRHLQQSIIYSLRAPSLYLPLRYEEKYLFGENWDDSIRQGSGIQHDIQLVKEWIIRYPTPNAAVRTYSKESKESTVSPAYFLEKKAKPTDDLKSVRWQIKFRIRKRIGQIWIGDNWARDQRLQYRALYALQLLKQRVLRDKIALYRASKEANLLGDKEHSNALDKSAFLVLRQGVIHQADRYVAILKNHKQQVSQALDFGMPSDPHPSTERRREMGIFMDFLSNRTQDIQRDILHLLNDYNKGNTFKRSDNLVLMFHGWSQETRVSNTHLFDKTNYHYNKFGLGENKKSKRHIGYINTSFWAPDRPDLHPIIAHEIAESVIKNTLGGLDDVALSNSHDSFTALLIELKKILLNCAKNNHHLSFLKEDSSFYIQQIAADLLAATVKGVSYLYSLFLLRIASDLHRQLEVSSFIRLDMAYSLKEGTASFDEALLWYIRIHLTASWIERVVHVDLSPLDKSIVEGSKTIADDILNFLDHNAPSIRKPRAKYWKDLVEDLNMTIKGSLASKDSKKWRKKRSKDDWDDIKPKATGCEGKKHFSRSTKRLNVRLQNYLFRELLAQKRQKEKPLHGVAIDKIEDKFNEIYPLKITRVCIPHVPQRDYRQPKELFRHMYDIPYQSSFLRSVDILTECPTPKVFFQQIRWDMELGRGLFSVALEFYSRETESPEHRLSLCINQVTFLHYSMKDSKLKTRLATWLNCNDMPLMSDDKIYSGNELRKADVEKIVDHIHAVGANNINAVFCFYKATETRIIRRLEEVAGYKLCELLSILEENIASLKHQPCYSAINSMMQFLSIRRKTKKDNQGKAKSLFYKQILAALGDISVKDKEAYEQSNQWEKRFLPKPAPSVMIDRISVTNLYPVPDPVNLKSNRKPYKNLNGLEFAKALKKDKWQTCYKTKTSAENTKNTWITMGRFDAVSMAEVRLPCKCYLPSFEHGLLLPYCDDESDIKKQLGEKFSPHFSRREIARPVTIINDSNEKAPIMQAMYKNLFAMIGVTLQRRSMRLDFLFRMIRALAKDNQPDASGIEQSICKLKERGIFVIAYLTDGWGDMLFTFRKNTDLEREDLDSIFAFQKDVYEDFMVDRTEILFTPQCLDYALANPDQYRVTMQTRMMEDRWLEAGIENYTEKLCKLCKDIPTDIISNVDITLTPGRNDFSFLFTGVENAAEGSYKKLIQWLDGKIASQTDTDKDSAMIMLGHLETYIERLLILNNKKV